MKKVLFVAAIALCAMGCCKKCDKSCQGQCCQEAAADTVVVEEAAADAVVVEEAAEVIE